MPGEGAAFYHRAVDAPITPLANILHRGTLALLVGEKIFARGETYFRDGRVQKLEREKGVLTATVRGTTTYEVRIWANRDGVAYKCQCPFGAEGLFCKHAVAVALAWVNAESTRDTAFQAQLRKLGQAELYAVVDAVAKTEAGKKLVIEALTSILGG